jgi:phosphoribosylformylglycinamidine synthase
VLLLDRQATGQDLQIEIRSCLPHLPAATPEIERLGLRLTERSRVFRIESNGAHLEPHHLAELFDPLTEEILRSDPDPVAAYLDVFCRPGVTDAEGEMASLALSHAGISGVTCHAGQRYRFDGAMSGEMRGAVEKLLGNDLVHRFLWYDEPEGRAGNVRGPAPGTARVPVQRIALSDAGDDELLAISRRLSLALDLDEMRAVAARFRSLRRNPTDVELQSIALAWSEHCSHKTFKATIHFKHEGRVEIIRGLLAEMLATPAAKLNRPWVRSAFVDNAGVIAFDQTRDVAFKVETHNHPSALEPYGGAHTGVGGVIRDVLAVSADPIANTDVLCFGPLALPEEEVPVGTFHPRRTYREVVRGIGDYGNNMGIPTVGGAILFDHGYTGNPLVFCGTLGLAPRGSHPRDPRPGDAIVLLGGRTGRDGLHGATMSSQTLDRATVASSTVQIGAPITEKLLRDVLPRLRDERLYHAVTDCGAGGLCSAVGEMGEALGVDLDLARVPLKYQGLLPWEIWLSEAQERMVLAVPESSLSRLHQICQAHDLAATVLGQFRDDGVLLLRYSDVVVAEIELGFMYGGRPQRVLKARWSDPSPPTPLPQGERGEYQVKPSPPPPLRGRGAGDEGYSLLRLLAHPNIASKEDVIRRYDHEVGAATIIKPLTANGGPSDAAVLRPTASWRGVVVAHGINPLYGRRDPHAMAMLAVDEALRNLVAVGGSIDRVALLDNFCWGDVDDPVELGALVRAAQGCRDAALAYGVPFISGKDSLRNTSVDESGTHSIPRTLLISAVGVVSDVRHTITMDLKRPSSSLYVLGMTSDELGESHHLALNGGEGGTVPRARPRQTRTLMRRLHRAIQTGLCLSCHDLSEGGLAVAVAEMALAGRLGAEIDLQVVPADSDVTGALLFGESAGRFLVEVAPEKEDEFRARMAAVDHGCVGTVTASGRLVVRREDEVVIDLSIEEIEGAWKGTLSLDSVALSSDAQCSAAPPRGSPGRVDPERGTSGGATPHCKQPAWLGEAGDGAPTPSRPRRTALHIPPRPPRIMVLFAAGVNCDRETVEACRLAGNTTSTEVELIHVNRLLAGEVSLRDFGMLIVPGGFSYGDHLGAGAMLASMLRHHLLGDLEEFVHDGRPVLGICNGFQIIARLGLLGDISLAGNQSGRFQCRWVPLRVTPSPCPFLDGLDRFELPIAHGEGRVVVSDEALTDLLTRAPLRYECNPNGSVAGIAAVCNPTGNVLGLMPHPERFVTPYQHPDRTRMCQPAGLVLFQNAIRYVSREL